MSLKKVLFVVFLCSSVTKSRASPLPQYDGLLDYVLDLFDYDSDESDESGDTGVNKNCKFNCTVNIINCDNTTSKSETSIKTTTTTTPTQTSSTTTTSANVASSDNIDVTTKQMNNFPDSSTSGTISSESTVASTDESSTVKSETSSEGASEATTPA